MKMHIAKFLDKRALEFGIKGEVKAFQGLLLLERGTRYTLSELFGLPSLYLILDYGLKEGEVVKLFFTGLLKPQIQDFQEYSKLEDLQLTGKVMFYVHECASQAKQVIGLKKLSPGGEKEGVEERYRWVT